ncbi:hypothetical protein AHAS_Ahas18G0197000 [Arachis hypogaea]
MDLSEKGANTQAVCKPSPAMCQTSMQHASCVLVSAVQVSASYASRKLLVDFGCPRVAHASARYIRVATCRVARGRPRTGNINKNLLPRKVDQAEAWHPAVEVALRTTGFYQLSRVGEIRGHSAMLTALVERWQPETHTFVMLVGEVTVTLEDVLHLFGLPIDGEVVTGWTDSSHNFLVTQSLAIFGSEPQVSSSSKSYISLSWVRHIRDIQPLDTWESIMRYVRCHIFYLLGTTLFVDKSTAYLHAKYLPL